jgi:uncharacterized membrane protein YjjP (DUF1212 family)
MTAPAAPDPALPLGDTDFALRRLIATLGAAMVASGQPIHEIEQELREMAARYGAPDLQVGVGPTGVHVALASGAPGTYQSVRGPLRLDQSATVRQIRYRLLAGKLGVEEATRFIRELPARPPAYPQWVIDVGFVGVGVGICLILQPGLMNLLAAAVSSVLVIGLLKVVRRHPSLNALLPTAAGFVVSLAVIAAAEMGWLDGSLRTVLPALAVLLPGALIVTGLSELAAGAMIAGTSRLLFGTVQLLLFAVGIVAAASLLRASPATLSNIRVDDLGVWAAPLGLLMIGTGIALMECVPVRLLPWVFGILALTFLAQFGGQQLGAPIFGSFLGAITASLGSSLAELADRRLPRLVVFLPSFWLLVPGSLGLLGVSEVATATASGTPTGAQVPAVVLAIAVGLLVGSAVANTIRLLGRSVQRLRSRPAGPNRPRGTIGS